MNTLKLLLLEDKNINLDSNNWEITNANSIEDAIEKLQQKDFEVVAIPENISKNDFNKLKSIIKITSEVEFLIDFKNEADLLTSLKEIENEIAIKNTNFLDNSFEMEVAGRISL